MRTECCKAYLGTHDNVLVCRKCGQENPHLSHVIHLTHSITESSARTLIDFLEQSVDRIEDHLNAGGDNDDARDVYLPQIASALDLRRHVVAALNDEHPCDSCGVNVRQVDSLGRGEDYLCPDCFCPDESLSPEDAELSQAMDGHTVRDATEDQDDDLPKQS